jgi:hypothetical protein
MLPGSDADQLLLFGTGGLSKLNVEFRSSDVSRFSTHNNDLHRYYNLDFMMDRPLVGTQDFASLPVSTI